MTCPRCSGTLQATSLRDLGIIHDVHRCSECEGLWVGPSRMRDISMTVDQRLIELRHLPSADEQQTPMKCPACEGGVVMRKVVSPRDANVLMDVCPACRHVWLDRGEREAIEQESLIDLIRDFLNPEPDSAS